MNTSQKKVKSTVT